MGITIERNTMNETILRKAGVKCHPIGRQQDRLLVLNIPAREAANHLVEKELRAIPGFERGTAVVYAGSGDREIFVQFFEDVDNGLEFLFDSSGNIVKAAAFEGSVEHEAEVTDSTLVRLAEKARAMYLSPGDVVHPSVPQEMLNRAEVDDTFVQRMVAGRRMVVLANWSGSMPPIRVIDGLIGKLVISRRQRVAKIVASPAGQVEVSYHRVAVEEDEHGFRRIVQQPDPERPSWHGPVERTPFRMRNAAKAAVDAAKAAEKDPEVVAQQVVWENPPRRDRPAPEQDVGEMS